MNSKINVVDSNIFGTHINCYLNTIGFEYIDAYVIMSDKCLHCRQYRYQTDLHDNKTPITIKSQ